MKNVKLIFVKMIKFIYSHLYIVVFACALLFMENVFANIMTNENANFREYYVLSSRFSLADVLVLTSLLILIPHKWKKYYATIILMLTSVLLIVNQIHFTVFKDFVSIKQLVLLNETVKFGGSAVNYFVPGHFILLLVAISSSILIIIFLRMNRFKANRILNLLITFAVLYVGLRAHQIAYSWIDKSVPEEAFGLYATPIYIYDNLVNTKQAFKYFGFFEYTKQDLLITFNNVFAPVDEGMIQEIDDYILNNPRVIEDNAQTGLLKDKNVIFVLAESLDVTALDPDLMPTLTQMMNEGIYFNNYYGPLYPRSTADSEFVFQTGLFPSISYGPTCYTFQNNIYPNSLANIFNQNGYNSNSFHNNYGNIYSRNMFHSVLGFEQFYDYYKLGMDLSDVRDSKMYNQGKDLIAPTATDKPFYSFIISFSGHGDYRPEGDVWNKFSAKVIEKYGDTLPKEVQAFFTYQMEFDHFLSVMNEDLVKKGLADDTVIVVVGDHYPYMLDGDKYIELKGTDEEYLYSQIPFLVYNPSIEPILVDELVSAVDIVPTLMNLFGIEYDPNLYFGKDIFAKDKENIVIFKDFSFYDGKKYYPADYIPNEEDKQYYRTTQNDIYEKTDIFQKILRSNYFKNK